LTGVFLGTKLALPALRESARRSPHGSAVVNLSSVAGLVGSTGDPLYSMTKGGALRQIVGTRVPTQGLPDSRQYGAIYTRSPYGGKRTRAMPTLHSFLRFSTPERALGDSERRQIEDMRRWAAANGYDFIDSYRAPGISGFRGEQRKVLQQFFDDVRSGRFPNGDALSVENFDRLSREPPLHSFDLLRLPWSGEPGRRSPTDWRVDGAG
jgi:Resolvase, N terminal domain